MRYLTPDDYKQAASNGIKESTLYARFYVYNWSREKAVHEPLRAKQTTPAMRQAAQEIGVPVDTVRSRLRKGWSEQEALYGKHA